MNEPQQQYARAWQVFSTILLSVAIAAFTWIVSLIVFIAIDWSDLINYGDEYSYILASLVTIIVFGLFLIYKWNSCGSSKLYTVELIVGALFIIGGGIYAYYGYTLDNAHVPTGMLSGLEFLFMMLIGVYVACVGVFAGLAGFLGWLSNPRMRENQKD